MRIGIMTFHNAINYGAVLQTYALRTCLSRMLPHDEVCVIDYRCKRIDNSYRIFAFRKERSFAKIFLFNALRLLYVPYNLKGRIHFSRFVQKTLCCVPMKNLDDFDCIIYGSDQIWNPELKGNDLRYFGANYSKRKIAYAASDGGLLSVSGETAGLLDKFSAISCREEGLSERLARQFPGKDFTTACDPVFLLEKGDWERLALPVQEKSFILVYKIGESTLIDKAAEKLRAETGKKVIQICYRRSLKKWFMKNQNIKTAVSPQAFLGYVKNADIVLTTSFHGTAFSIIFEKEFYTFKIPTNEERITCLLAVAGLSEHYVDAIPKYTPPHDKSAVRERIACYRAKSLRFLQGALHGSIVY